MKINSYIDQPVIQSVKMGKDIPTNTVQRTHDPRPDLNRNMSAFQVLIVIMCFIMNMNDGIDVMVVSYTGFGDHD